MPPVERDLLEVDVRRLQAERVRAAGRADVAMVLLKQLLGMDPAEPLRLRETIETLVDAPALPRPRCCRARFDRPDVREAEARVTLAGARVDEARREGRVDVSLFGAYMRMDAGFPQQGCTLTDVLGTRARPVPLRGGGAVIALPLFNRNQGDIASAGRHGRVPRLASKPPRWPRAPRSPSAVARDAQAQHAVAFFGGTAERSRGRISTSSVRRSSLAGQRSSTSSPSNAGSWISSRPTPRRCARRGKRAPP